MRPHTPLHVPSRWFELYGPDSFSLPVQRKNDRDDTYLEQHSIEMIRILSGAHPKTESDVQGPT